MTWKEWLDLPVSVKSQYPKDFCSPVWNGYYVGTMLIHILMGDKITKRVWDSMPEGYQNYLIKNYLTYPRKINKELKLKTPFGVHFPYPPTY